MYSTCQGLTKLLNALKESQNKETVDGIIKEAGEFQEVFKILEGGRQNLSQLEVRVAVIWLLFWWTTAWVYINNIVMYTGLCFEVGLVFFL